MNTPTFRESYDKIIDAYFKDEIKPFDGEFCFCGTLHGNSEWMSYKYRRDNVASGPYTAIEYAEMEQALFAGLREMEGAVWARAGHKTSEEALFNGMSRALDILKQIHESRGEVIEPFEFKKRELAAMR